MAPAVAQATPGLHNRIPVKKKGHLPPLLPVLCPSCSYADEAVIGTAASIITIYISQADILQNHGSSFRQSGCLPQQRLRNRKALCHGPIIKILIALERLLLPWGFRFPAAELFPFLLQRLFLSLGLLILPVVNGIKHGGHVLALHAALCVRAGAAHTLNSIRLHCDFYLVSLLPAH